MTPLTNPRTEQEQAYNRAHARSRSTVERAIGLLKGRWLCLSSTGGTLQYQPEKACKIIMACSVLHNLAIRPRNPSDQTALCSAPATSLCRCHSGKTEDHTDISDKSGHWPSSETLQRFITFCVLQLGGNT